MGNYFTSGMEENIKKNQEFMHRINVCIISSNIIIWIYRNIHIFIHNVLFLDGEANTTSISDARATNGDANC